MLNPDTTGPRADPKKRPRLVAEHNRRKGDPTAGGRTRSPSMTAYGQQALACASALALRPRKVRELKPDIPNAANIMRANFYGWFDRTERGVYGLTDAGRAALKRWPQQVMEIADAGEVVPT